jgi:superfamily II DNA or RNA helicase
MNPQYVPRDYMDTAIASVFTSFEEYQSALVVMSTGCHQRGQGVLMYDGSIRKVEDLLPGDRLMGPDSKPRTIKSLCRGRESMVRVVPIKGDSWVVNRSHILSLVETTRCANSPFPSRQGGRVTDVAVKDWMGWSQTQKHIHKLFRVGVEFPKQQERLRVHPYLLGLLLGDGSGLIITTEDEEVVTFLREEAERRFMKLSEYAYEGRTPGYALTGVQGMNYCRGGSPFVDELKLLGVWGKTAGEKFIPQQYKVASRKERLELLAGLIDTDGSLQRSGGYDFISKSQVLANDLAFVARSVGLAAHVTPCEKCSQNGTWGTYYRVGVHGHVDMIPCRIARKQSSARKQKKNVLRTGFSVEELPEDDYYGFSLDGDGRYLLDDFTVTHNTGKTEVYLQVAERFIKETGLKVLVIAHREELISQPAKRWHRNTDTWPMIEMGDLRAGSECLPEGMGGVRNDRLVICTVQTLNSGRRCNQCTADCQACSTKGKIYVDCEDCHGEPGHECEECEGDGKVKKKCKPCKGDGWICVQEDCDHCFEHFCRRMQKFDPEEFGLIIIDEAHHSPAVSYLRAIRYFRSKNKKILLLGLTATPDRADEEALGQVYETVAYIYNLPHPITDGWLTPVDQRFIVIDELNLSNIRTTAGDLNEGDLEIEMLLERVLHKVTTPLVEIACGLEEGTIDRLIKMNGLSDLPDLCTKREPTLVHAASVAHAERMTEIINRYLPDSALCIVGTTAKDVRRDGIERFGAGHYQFMLSCGVFLEGTDLPNVSVVGMARPTKSRALYAQMLGRGLRPLSGLVDGIPDAAERRRLIEESDKRTCTVIDFVGNSGRHKLISVADILGDAFPDEMVSTVIRKAVSANQPIDILKELQRIREEEEQRRRELARQDAARRAEREQQLQKQAAARRAGIVAGATYIQRQVDPFGVFDLAPAREPGWFKGKVPTEGQREFLRKAKVPIAQDASFWDAHRLCEEVSRRRKEGLSTFKQTELLQEWGFTNADQLKFDKASRLIGAKLKPLDFEKTYVEKIRQTRNEVELDRVKEELRGAGLMLPEAVAERIRLVGVEKRQSFKE